MSKVSINESTLTNIGAAIREKTGKTDLIAPGDMPAEIRAIESGGGGVEVEPLVLTGNCDYACMGQMASTYIELFGDTVSTSDITGAQNMFKGYARESVPFDLNFKNDSGCYVSYLFQNSKLKAVPRMINLKPYSTNEIFASCAYLREIPDDVGVNWDYSEIEKATYYSYTAMCSGCFSLKAFPEFLNEVVKKCVVTSTYSSPYRDLFNSCYNMREVNGLGVSTATYTSNAFSNTFNKTYMLKKFTFETNEDGTPQTAKWKSQTIDLTTVGCDETYPPRVLSYNCGVTADKEVIDDASYQALKDDPDYFTGNWDYARYNHDSAVETINSLPDCSATGTNTIKFKGAAGAKTDGGAISNLTEEEIAVATAKGWTVTLV